jgi:V/A-type H+/Na+-transporting ATPase subunit F
MDYRIAIIGSEEEILGFKGLGLEAIVLESPEEVEDRLVDLKRMSPQQYAIVFVMEELFQGISADGLKKLSIGALPAIVPLPGHKGSTGYGNLRMRKFVEQAIGSDIFAN